MNQKNSKPKVFFNASVIIAGLNSPSGGSAKILSWNQNHKISGIISEIVEDEVKRHSAKTNFHFTQIQPAPKKTLVDRFANVVIDPGDAHILASCYESKADYLVTLDKKHILILQNQVRWTKIVSPGELIKILS